MGIVLARPESKHDKATRINIPQATAAQGVARKRSLLANNSREQADEAKEKNDFFQKLARPTKGRKKEIIGSWSNEDSQETVRDSINHLAFRCGRTVIKLGSSTQLCCAVLGRQKREDEREVGSQAGRWKSWVMQKAASELDITLKWSLYYGHTQRLFLSTRSNANHSKLANPMHRLYRQRSYPEVSISCQNKSIKCRMWEVVFIRLRFHVQQNTLRRTIPVFPEILFHQ